MQIENCDSVVLICIHVSIAHLSVLGVGSCSVALPKVSSIKFVFLNMAGFSSLELRVYGQRMSFTLQRIKPTEAK